MEPCSDAVTETKGGVTILLDVTAGARRTTFPAGYNEWRKSIRCQVAAPALGGKANRAVIDIVAETFGVSRADVSIISGHTSTSKVIAIAGLLKSEALAILSACGA
ncbi:MAG: YggU family protein [Methanomicrobiales archaeon]|nr:YggU family protein [Methanomicrobiales archaeon]